MIVPVPSFHSAPLKYATHDRTFVIRQLPYAN